jgi:hypothetical protein
MTRSYVSAVLCWPVCIPNPLPSKNEKKSLYYQGEKEELKRRAGGVRNR